MNETAFESIKAYGSGQGFELIEQKDTFTIQFKREKLLFRVTVAFNVLEWFLDIEDMLSDLKFHDWGDYVGYDKRHKEELALEMIDHLHRLFHALLEKQFRLQKGRTFFIASDKCEWLIDGKWIEFNYGDT
ncbi:MAG: hypothetical protein C0625_04865 [Arcobacter sp.]|nr:MAG: hypothetical protein C0625_04865 [Arcobacter sp.]